MRCTVNVEFTRGQLYRYFPATFVWNGDGLRIGSKIRSAQRVLRRLRHCNRSGQVLTTCSLRLHVGLSGQRGQLERKVIRHHTEL